MLFERSEDLRDLAANLIAKWEKKMNLKVTEFGIKKMRTK
jgi:predicted metal-dependent hydrolase